MNGLGDPKPPVGVHVSDLQSFARLALSLTDSPPLLWHFKHGRRHVVGTFSVYMYWRGDIPLFTYIWTKKAPEPFLAYRSEAEKEEAFFTNNIEDPKYIYSPLIDLKEPPSILTECLDGKWPSPQKPLVVELNDLSSVARLLFLITSKEYTAFPIWHFKRDRHHYLGVCIPFEHYYEANALPVFFYVKARRNPEGPFLRYITSKVGGENLGYTKSTSETKYFYAKIVDVKDMPLFPKI